MKKYDSFSRVFDIANQLLTRHSPFTPLGQVNRNIFGLWLLKKNEKSMSLTDSNVQTFLEGEEIQNTMRKTESYVLSGFGNGISRG